MKIASITDMVTASGLRLAGLEEVYEVEDEKKASDLFEDLTEREEIGVLIITERLAQGIREKIRRFTEKRERITPIIAEIPDKEGPIPERKEVIRSIIKRAVGVEIKR